MSGFEFLRIGMSVAGVLVATVVIARICWESAFNDSAEDLSYPPVRRLRQRSQVESKQQPKDDLSITSLFMAAEKGNVLAAARLIGQGADVNEVGADVDQPDRFGCTALHTAVRAQQCDMVAFLLAQPGIQLEIRDADNRTACECAQLLFQNARLERQWACANAASSLKATSKKTQNCRNIFNKIRVAQVNSENYQSVAAVTSDAVPAIDIVSRQASSSEKTTVTAGAPSKRVRFDIGWVF